MLPNGRRDSGGMNIYLKEMLRYLPPAGVAIDLFTMDHPNCVTPIYRISPRSRVIHIPAAPPDTPKERLYEYIHQFTQSVEQFILRDNASYTTVYSHYWWSGITGAAIARRMGIPHSITFHTLARLKQRYLAGNVEHPQRAIQEQVLAQTADRLIVWTPHEKEMLIKLYNAPADKISIIPPGVDTSSFRPLDRRAARAALGLDEPQKMILAVGRITKIKGLPLLIRAGSSLDTVADAKIHVVGGDTTKDSRRELCQQVTDLGMRDRVKLWGPMPHSRLPLMYAAADVFVMPSYYESFGLAAMEAAASATPPSPPMSADFAVPSPTAVPATSSPGVAPTSLWTKSNSCSATPITAANSAAVPTTSPNSGNGAPSPKNSSTPSSNPSTEDTEGHRTRAQSSDQGW